jgi:uncharacterized membrane protein
MREPIGCLRIPEWLILIGSSLFIAVLVISAYFEARALGTRCGLICCSRYQHGCPT